MRAQSRCAELAYDINQDQARQSCERIADWSAHSECLKKTSMTYQQYDKHRSELPSKPPQQSK
jgi:hypothetical protein